MSSDLKSARAYVIPLGGKETEKNSKYLDGIFSSC